MWFFKNRKNEQQKPLYDDIIGDKNASHNSKFTITCSDFCESSGSGGFRNSGDGQYALFENGRRVLQGKLQRPNDGKVANNGTFIINDWMFGEGLKSTFYAFDRQGKIILKRYFKANLFNNGISQDGSFAVCQTCNSDNEDGNTLNLFALLTGNQLWQIKPETGWADSYEIDTVNSFLYVVHKDLGKFRYNFKGEFLDADNWKRNKIEKGNPYELLTFAKLAFDECKKDGTFAERKQEISSLCERALEGFATMGGPNIDIYKAQVYRLIGETYEMSGERNYTIKYFEMAMALNPKVGVKMKLQKIKKEK